MCVLSQNESLQLELSDSATPDNSTRRRATSPDDSTRRRATSPDDSARHRHHVEPNPSSQLSAILAPNSLLYSGDLDNIIDNDEDVQVYSVGGDRPVL